MTKEIDVQTLQTWLAESRPVAIVDIRADEARRQWSIPGRVE